MTEIAVVLVLVLVVLSVVHLYWLFGGELGLSSSVPEVDGRPAFWPGPFAKAAVAALLLLAAVACAWHGELLGLRRTVLSRIAVVGLAAAFLLRAVGDFRLVGSFKRVRGTRFARLDTWLYSPLCWLIAVLCAVLARMPAGSP